MVSQGKLPPPDYGQDSAAIAKVFQQDDGDEIDCTSDNELPEIVAQYEALKMARKTADDGIKEAQARIMHRLGPCAAGAVCRRRDHVKDGQSQKLCGGGMSYRNLSIRHTRHKED